MKKRDDRLVLEPTEEQKLRLQLAQRDRDLNLERRGRLDAELRFHESQIQRFTAGLELCQATKAQVEQLLAFEEASGQQLEQVIADLAEEIRTQNLWPATATLDQATLTFSAPAGKVPTKTKSGQEVIQ